jgi:hypothetical protein
MNAQFTLRRVGAHAVQKLSPIPQSEYVKSLDDGRIPARLSSSAVRYWSDYSRVYFHPRSIVPIYDNESDPALSSTSWESGHQLFSSLEREEELIDRDWRPFVEECDKMQGIKLITTIDDDWGGFATAYSERLRDEYGKCCIWTWALHSPNPKAGAPELRAKLATTLNSVVSLCDISTTFVPLALPAEPLPAHVNVNPRSQWDTSALLATGMETAALASRMAKPSGDIAAQLHDFSECLNARGCQPVAKLRMSVGDQGNNDWQQRFGSDEDIAIDKLSPKWMDFSSVAHLATRSQPRHDQYSSGLAHIFGRVMMARDSSRGISIDEGLPPSIKSLSRGLRHSCALEFPLLDSFPDIYPGNHIENRLQVHTMLSSESSLADDFKNLQVQARRLAGLDRESLVNSLGDMVDAYKEGWSSDDDGYD